MTETSSVVALEIFAELAARQKTWYYEINVLASLGIRVCSLGFIGLTISYLYGSSRPYDNYCYFQPVALGCLFLCTFAFWRLRQRFETDNGLADFRQFIRLHSRLTYFDSN